MSPSAPTLQPAPSALGHRRYPPGCPPRVRHSISRRLRLTKNERYLDRRYLDEPRRKAHVLCRLRSHHSEDCFFTPVLSLARLASRRIRTVRTYGDVCVSTLIAAPPSHQHKPQPRHQLCALAARPVPAPSTANHHSRVPESSASPVPVVPAAT